MTRESLWANDLEEEIVLDEEEFNKLFIDEANSESPTKQKKTESAKEPKKQKIILVDMKRAQNGGIALARIKMPYPDVKNKIMNMSDDGLSTEQLKYLEDFLPTSEESDKLKSFKGSMIAF